MSTASITNSRSAAPRLLVSDPVRSYAALKPELDEAMASVFKRGQFILGPEVLAFEEEFAAYLDCGYAIGVASGTDALRLALLAAGVQPGDEVVTVGNAGDPTPMAICSVGAIPRFVDVDHSTYTMSAEQAEKAVGPRTKALLPVHLYGQAADLDDFRQIARHAHTALIEDACQAHGAEFGGRRVGGVGDLGCFSFYPTKNLGGFGDGGMVTTNDSAVAERLRMLREYGWRPRNHAFMLGVNSRLDELQAAALRVKLHHLDEWTARRRELASAYREGLEGVLGVTVPREAPGRKHVYHLYVVRTQIRDQLAAALDARGVSTAIHYPVPAHRQVALHPLVSPGVDLPVTERLAEEVLSLPMFPEMTVGDCALVVDTISALPVPAP